MTIIFTIICVVIFGWFCGWIFKERIREAHLSFFMNFIIYSLIPCFVFANFYKKIELIPLIEALKSWVFYLIILSFLLFFIKKTLFKEYSYNELYLPFVSVNGGAVAIPILKGIWGAEGARFAILYNLLVGLWLYTIGLAISTGNIKEGIKRFLKLPTIYTLLLVWFFKKLNIKIPEFFINTLDKIGFLGLFLLLFILGIELTNYKLCHFKKATILATCKLILSFFSFIIFLSLFKNSFYNQMIFINYLLPPAIMSGALSKKYRINTPLCLCCIFISTCLFLILLPFLIYIASLI